MSKRLLLIFTIFSILALTGAVRLAAQNTPIQVSGNFSSADASASALGARPAALSADETVVYMMDLVRQQKYREAIKEAEIFTKTGNSDARVNLVFAQGYEGLKDWDKAGYYAGEFIARRPSDPRGYNVRANAYYQKANYTDAKIDIDRSLRIQPSSLNAKKIKDLIDAATTAAAQAKTQPTANPLAGQRPSADNTAVTPAQTPATTQQPPKKSSLEDIRWWIIYLFVAIILAAFFVYIRSMSSSKSSGKNMARRLDIKEQYNFIRQIGEGGMGKVYEAYDKTLKRRVAIKRVRPELVRSNYVREQFMSEARTVALLRHPNIVEIYTVIESDNSLYLVFEYVDGQTLETRLDIDGFVPFSELKNVFENVCRGLQYAHSQDIIHCDLKPGNIMVNDKGIAKVMDFGVAKRVVGDDTGARTVAGTPAYMAPEQQKGFMRKQSDIYSLAVCLYEGLVGQVPWSVAGFDIANKKIVPPSKLAPYIPKEVDALVEKALMEDPNERIQSIEEFWSILNKIEPLKEQPRPRHI